jgi:hypothetical protein
MFDLTPAHLHLLVNHLPVEGSIFGALLLLFAIIRNNAELKRTAFLVLIFVGIATFVADTTGGGAARIVRKIPSTDRKDITEHAQSADYAKAAAGITGAVALIGLVFAWRRKDKVQIVSSNGTETTVQSYVRYHKAPHTGFVIACLVLSLFEISVIARTAYLGGKIRHPEIESSYQAPATADTTNAKPAP